jgi:hypothetical protein
MEQRESDRPQRIRRRKRRQPHHFWAGHPHQPDRIGGGTLLEYRQPSGSRLLEETALISAMRLPLRKCRFTLVKIHGL